jgi:beta-galactosidase
MHTTIKDMARILSFLVLLLTSAKCFAQRDTVVLSDNWQFKIDKAAVGLNEKWFALPLNAARTVSLPHTWNVETENQNHYGWAWYQKKIDVPASWRKKNVVLRFGAINHTAKIYLNGVQIAERLGDGFNPISVSLNKNLKYGKKNIVTVWCNNDYGTNKVPFANSFDWANDGGMIRKVALIISGKPAANYIRAISRLDYKNNSGSLALKLGFESYSKDIRLSVRIHEENQSTHQLVLDKLIQPKWEGHEAKAEFTLDKVNPWHFDFPNLYRVEVKVFYKDKEVDLISTNIGFRDIQMVNNQFFLNGEHVKLMGVEWTAGSNPDFGFAEPDSEIIRNGKLMKEVNAIFSRQHFQQDELFYDFCDRNGIILQQEVPLWGPETPANPVVEKIAQDQLKRMIEENYNHPSIFSWGVGNELDGRNPDMKGMIKRLIDTARRLDTNRNVAYVSNTLTKGFINNPKFTPDAGSLGDYIMMNEYGGSWWSIPTGQIHNYLDSIHMSYPDKPFFISEFGLCEPNFKGGDERRIEDLIYHMAIYESKSYVEGAIYFDLTDYRTHYPGTSENNKFRRRIHGVYDMYGQPKPSMKVLRELSSPVEVQDLQKKQNGKMNIIILGSIGLPQYAVKGYRVYLSKGADDYLQTKSYPLPTLQPGVKINLEVDDLYNGGGFVTVIRPNGYVVSQKSFH